MTLRQFNNTVEDYCNLCNGKDTQERFVFTIGGRNILYTKTTVIDPVWKNINSLSATLDGWVFSEVEDIPSQFEIEKWAIPTFIKCDEGEISPEDVKIQGIKDFKNSGTGVVLYNNTKCAWCLPYKNVHEIGIMTFRGGAFGLTDHCEFISWLSKTGQAPFKI